MCFIFTCGEHEFSKQLQGYEGVTCQCHNCGNYSGHVISRWPWFTFCFIPVIPLAFHRYEDIVCTICNFAQPLANRPDVLSQHPGGNGQIPLQNYNGGPPGGGPPPGWNGVQQGGQKPQAQPGMVYQ